MTTRYKRKKEKEKTLSSVWCRAKNFLSTLPTATRHDRLQQTSVQKCPVTYRCTQVYRVPTCTLPS